MTQTAGGLPAAIDGLARLKDEHRELIAAIARDPGMLPATRELLLSHIYAEEDERVAELQALQGGGAAPAAAAPGTPGLTVGCLRGREPGVVGLGDLRVRS